ncbi:hypothetical protein, partial [Gemmatimonas sp.]|uniref:hypothetical protein n=1 Tax=Gemmatimonas sp. TaxID=1962908 RepID=UPI00356199BA
MRLSSYRFRVFAVRRHLLQIALHRSVLLATLGATVPALNACRDSAPTAVTPPSTGGPKISSLIASPASLNLQ